MSSDNRSPELRDTDTASVVVYTSRRHPHPTLQGHQHTQPLMLIVLGARVVDYTSPLQPLPTLRRLQQTLAVVLLFLFAIVVDYTPPLQPLPTPRRLSLLPIPQLTRPY